MMIGKAFSLAITNDSGAFGICLFIMFFGGILAFVIRITSGISKLSGSLDSSIQILQDELDSIGHCFEEPFKNLKTIEALKNAIKRPLHSR